MNKKEETNLDAVVAVRVVVPRERVHLHPEGRVGV